MVPILRSCRATYRHVSALGVNNIGDDIMQYLNTFAGVTDTGLDHFNYSQMIEWEFDAIFETINNVYLNPQFEGITFCNIERSSITANDILF